MEPVLELARSRGHRAVGVSTKTGSVRALAVTIAALAAASGCVAPSRGEGRECLFNRDCAEPLVCAARACRAPCRTSADCTLRYECVETGEAGVRACVPPGSEALCESDGDCADAGAKTFCAPDRTCRVPCLADRDCYLRGPGLRCVQSACVASDSDAGVALDASLDALTSDDAAMMDAITSPPIDSSLPPRDSAVTVNGDASFVLRAAALGGRSLTHCALSADAGPVLCWGANGSAQVGTSMASATGATTPTLATAWSGFAVVELTASLGDFSDETRATVCARMSDGSVRCVGEGAAGQLGNGAFASSVTPVIVSGITNAQQLCMGRQFACALLSDGTVRCWGNNANGQLANGSVIAGTRGLATPTPALGLNNVRSIACGGAHVCALDASDGSVRCWGQNFRGETGGAIASAVTTPTVVPGITGARAITAGQSSAAQHALSCAVMADRTVRCWGSNAQQQLGAADAGTYSSVPVTIVDAVEASAIATTGTAICYSRADTGRVLCWGDNNDGTLGNPSRPFDTTRPFAVLDLPPVIALVAGGNNSSSGTFCALTTESTIWCWGSNLYGQVGSSVVRASRPLPVLPP